MFFCGMGMVGMGVKSIPLQTCIVFGGNFEGEDSLILNHHFGGIPFLTLYFFLQQFCLNFLGPEKVQLSLTKLPRNCEKKGTKLISGNGGDT